MTTSAPSRPRARFRLLSRHGVHLLVALATQLGVAAALVLL